MNVPAKSVVPIEVPLTDKQLARVAAGGSVSKRVTVTVEIKRAQA